MRLSGTGVVPLHGLDYKDQPADAAAWLDEMGDPYTRPDGRRASVFAFPDQAPAEIARLLAGRLSESISARGG